MKKFTMFLFAALFTAFLTLSAAPPDKNWSTDFKKATAEAKSKNLPLFLVFTRTDGNPLCLKFESKILGSSKVKAFTKNKFVFVYLDCPRKPDAANAATASNLLIAEQYKVKTCPTVIITDSNGQEVGKLNDSSDREFVSRLRKIYDKVKKNTEHSVKK